MPCLPPAPCPPHQDESWEKSLDWQGERGGSSSSWPEALAGSIIPVLGLWAPARQGRACSVRSKTGCTRERPSNCCCEAEEKLILILESIPALEGSASTLIGQVAGMFHCSRGPCSLNLGDVQPSGYPRQHHPPPGAPQARPHLPAQEEALAPASAQKALGALSVELGPLPRHLCPN